MSDQQQLARFLGGALRSLPAPTSDDPWRRGVDPTQVVEHRSPGGMPDHHRICCREHNQYYTQANLGPGAGGNLHPYEIVDGSGGYNICVGWANTLNGGVKR